MKTKQLKQYILNQHESIGISKPCCCFSCAENWELAKLIAGTTFRRSRDCLHSHIFKHSQAFSRFYARNSRKWRNPENFLTNIMSPKKV